MDRRSDRKYHEQRPQQIERYKQRHFSLQRPNEDELYPRHYHIDPEFCAVCGWQKNQNGICHHCIEKRKILKVLANLCEQCKCLKCPSGVCWRCYERSREEKFKKQYPHFYSKDGFFKLE